MSGLTDRGRIKSKPVNLVLVMFWYYWTYMVAIGKKLQTNEKLKRWLTNPDRNFNETNEPEGMLWYDKSDNGKRTIFLKSGKDLRGQNPN